MKKVISLILSLVLVMIGANSDVLAYGKLSHKLNTSKTYVYFVHSDFTQASFSAMNECFWRWSQATGHNIVSRHPTQRHTLTDYGQSSSGDGLNLVYRVPVGSGGYIAQNSYRWSSGLLTESDINFNMDKNFANGAASNCYDTFSIFLHEVGHTIGLADETVDGLDPVMLGNWYYRKNTISYRTLRQDDIDGAKSIYR